MRRSSLCHFGLTLALLGGCGAHGTNATRPTEAPPSPPPSAAAPPPDRQAVPRDPHALSRATVHAVVARGLGAFLQHVELDDQPVRSGGKFVGFRIAALHDADFWRGVDLKPGDVVVSVNGFPIERPEQALTVFDSLDVASELRVAYLRDGQPRELVYAIVGDR